MRVERDNNSIDYDAINGTIDYIAGIPTGGGTTTSIQLSNGQRALQLYMRSTAADGWCKINGGDLIRIVSGSLTIDFRGILVNPLFQFNSPVNSYMITYIQP